MTRDAVSLPAFERDPRLTRLETVVAASGEDRGRSWVVLADTVLYPEGGGQPADRGRLEGTAVVDVQRVDGAIRHFLDGPAPSGVVTVELDWARRFDHMQQHTAQHLLTAVADRVFGWSTTAFHLGGRTCDIELDTPVITPARLVELEEAVAAEVRAARPVTARRVPLEEYGRLPVRSRGLPAGHTGDVRLVGIEGVDLSTCGGTHCASTAEIEALTLLGSEPMRGGTRLFWVAGGRLRRLHGERHELSARLRALLGAADEELVAAVEAKLDQLKDAHRRIRGLLEESAVVAARRLAEAGTLETQPGESEASRAGVLHAHWPDRDLAFLQRVARELEALASDRAAFLTAGEEEGFFLVAAGPESGLDVASAGPRIAELLEGRGGGSSRVFQGKAARLSARREALASLRAR